MPFLKKKFNIPTIIAAISFIYLAFSPLIITPIFNLIMGYSFGVVIESLINYIFTLSSIIFFWSYIIIAVGILTKFDKITVAASAALLWIGSIISFISYIINSTKSDYNVLRFNNIISHLAYILAYFLLFGIAAWLIISFIQKKPRPKFLKVLVFVPVVMFVIILVFLLFSNISNLIAYSVNGIPAKYFINSLFLNLSEIFNVCVLIIGFTAVIIEITGVKINLKNR